MILNKSYVQVITYNKIKFDLIYVVQDTIGCMCQRILVVIKILAIFSSTPFGMNKNNYDSLHAANILIVTLFSYLSPLSIDKLFSQL